MLQLGVDLVARRADLDDLLARLDPMAPGTATETEVLDELRGRIEILMDEITSASASNRHPFRAWQTWRPTPRDEDPVR